ncbi:FAD/NAD(P)-binding protein [Agrobacterium vitis]
MKRIAIIGMGGTGTAAFANLIKHLIAAGEWSAQVFLIDRAPIDGAKAFAGGTAFGTPACVHRLNTAVADMGVFADQRDDFRSWLESNRDKWNDRHYSIDVNPDDFLPRPFFTEYLQDVLDRYEQMAATAGIKVSRFASGAINLSKISGRFWIELANGTFVVADAAILALGQPEGTRFPKLQTTAKFVDSPWPVQRLVSCIPKDQPTTILGTGLTAVDTVLTLVAYGHQGPIRMISRNGLLPEASGVSSVRRPNKILSKDHIETILRGADRLRLSELFKLFKLELRARGGRIPIELCPVSRFRTSIYAAAQNANILQDVLANTRFIGSWLWSLLSITDKLRFQRRFGSQWTAYRYAMPIQTARSILRLMESGQLEVIGGFAGVVSSPSGFALSTRQGGVLHTDTLIDATGPSNDVRLTQVPLVQSLLRKGLCLPHAAGGVQADTETFELLGSQGCTAGLYAVGQILSGQLFATNGFWFNVDCISVIVDRIVRHASPEEVLISPGVYPSLDSAISPELRNIA